jgi:hypothetical protein
MECAVGLILVNVIVRILHELQRSNRSFGALQLRSRMVARRNLLSECYTAVAVGGWSLLTFLVITPTHQVL